MILKLGCFIAFVLWPPNDTDVICFLDKLKNRKLETNIVQWLSTLNTRWQLCVRILHAFRERLYICSCAIAPNVVLGVALFSSLSSYVASGRLDAYKAAEQICQRNAPYITEEALERETNRGVFQTDFLKRYKITFRCMWWLLQNEAVQTCSIDSLLVALASSSLCSVNRFMFLILQTDNNFCKWELIQHRKAQGKKKKKKELQSWHRTGETWRP